MFLCFNSGLRNFFLTPHLGGRVKHAKVFMDTSHYFHVFILSFTAFPHLQFSHIIAGKMSTIHKTKLCICPHGHIQNLTISASFLLQGHLYYNMYYPYTGNPQFALCKSESTNMISGKPYSQAKAGMSKYSEPHPVANRKCWLNDRFHK